MIDILFSPVNMTLTVLLIILILYWIISMLTGTDWDVDVDIDVNVDIDIDIDADINHQIPTQDFEFGELSNTEINKEDILSKRLPRKLKWWQIVLIHFNFVGLPFMFTFTCWIFFWWFTTLLSTYITGSYDNSFGFILFFILLIPSLYLTKLFTIPFKAFFKNLNKDGDQAINFEGRLGHIRSSISGKKLGTAELIIEGNPYILNVKAFEGQKIEYGQQILVIIQDSSKTFYLVKPYSN